MITRRSLFGLTFGGAVATHLDALHDSRHPEMRRLFDEVARPASPEKPQDETVAKPTPPIRLTIGAHGHACKVEVAGIDVSRMCRSARIYAEAGEVTRLQLDMLVLEGSEIVAEPGAIDVQVRNLPRRLRFEADNVRVKADV